MKISVIKITMINGQFTCLPPCSNLYNGNNLPVQLPIELVVWCHYLANSEIFRKNIQAITVCAIHLN